MLIRFCTFSFTIIAGFFLCSTISFAQENVSPVYRFYSFKNKAHFFTASESEKDRIISRSSDRWRYEGIAFYVPDISPPPNYGPSITVGLWSFTRSELRDDSFRIDADKSYVIKNISGTVLATIPKDVTTRVKYLSDGNLRVYESVPEDIVVSKEVFFEPADGNLSDIIFDVHKPNSSYDDYRGQIKLRYSDTSKNIWVINDLPMELYLWGFGEITGTGDDDHDRAMVTAARTYAYWKLLYSTKHATEGFKIDTTAGDQIYRGYVWEQAYPDIKKAAGVTRGKVLKHGSDIALSPYSSWTDGRTRSFQERWGSTLYPWCQSVPDPYGKHPSKSTAQLESEGNHMVGISANGSLRAATDHGWSWERILTYYLTDVVITNVY